MTTLAVQVLPSTEVVNDYDFNNKCDSCPAKLVYKVYKLGTHTRLLQFCNHHAHMHYPSMVQQGWNFAAVPVNLAALKMTPKIASDGQAV